MEVNTANISSVKNNQDIDVQDRSRHGPENDIVRVTKNKINFEKVMMNPDEVKTFLYMLMGAHGIHLITDGNNLGSSVNKLV